MKVSFTQTIDARICVTARLSPEGEFSTNVAAICKYAPDELDNAEVSVSVVMPPEFATAVREAMEAARQAVMADLGTRLQDAKVETYKVAARHKEVGQ